MVRSYRVPAVLLLLPAFFAGCSVLKEDSSATKPEATAPKTSEAVAKPAATERSAEKSVPSSTPMPEAPKTEPPASAPTKIEAPAPSVSEPPATTAAPVEKPAASVSEPPPKKSGPNNFIVTVATKTSQHPFFGKGHSLGLVVDGVPGGSVVLRRGQVYEFTVKTDALHDVYFSTSPLGWGGGAVTQGIKGQFTYNGTITVTPTAETPDVMYYSCRNHNSMGGKVVVVSANASKAEIDRLLASSPTTEISESATSEGMKDVPADKARQKIMLAEMMLQSKNAKAVSDGPDSPQKKNLTQAKEKIQSARKEVDAGRNTSAVKLAEESLQLISSATRAMTSEDKERQQKTKFAETMDTLHNFQESHKQNYERTVKKRGASAAVDYDHAKVNSLVAEAKASADKGEYEAGIQSLNKAERLVTQAIQKMLDSQTIVYDLNFETPAEEYDYEFKRYKGYEELIPVAIEEKKPAESVVKLMDTYVEKGRAQKTEAERLAKAGNYPDAISLMLSATEEIRRALRLAGVSQ